MAQQLFFSTLLSYLLCMCMCAALQQVGDATHKIAALFYCVGVTVSPMTVSQNYLSVVSRCSLPLYKNSGQQTEVR